MDIQPIVRGTLDVYIATKFYGFVNLEDGTKAFLHGSIVRKFFERRSIPKPELMPGDLVEGEIGMDNQGRKRFIELTRLDCAEQAMRTKGVIKKYYGEKGYGFISCDEEIDIFFHHSALKHTGIDRGTIEGRSVSVDYKEDDRGLRATSIMFA